MAQLGYNVTIEQLANMLGTSQNPQLICASGNINKWSKRKPIHYSQTQPLSDAQFKGMSTDISQGIIYGLRAGVARTNIANLHSADWEYVGRPQGGIPNSPYRVDDFWGYEKDITYPTLSGAGLSDGQRVQIGSTTTGISLVWNNGNTSVVDIAEVFTAYTNQTPNYGDMYLCALIGTRARALVNNDIGGVYPIYYNSTYCRSFSIPSTSAFLGSDQTQQVTLFFASSVDVNTSINGVTMANGWVDFSVATGAVFTSVFVTVPNQVNLSVSFVLSVRQYITSFDMSYSRGMLSFQFTQGPDWNSASGYRIVISVANASGQTGPVTTTDIGLDGIYLTPSIATIMSNAGFVQTGFATTYTFKATFQVLSGGSYTDTTFSDSETITLTSW